MNYENNNNVENANINLDHNDFNNDIPDTPSIVQDFSIEDFHKPNDFFLELFFIQSTIQIFLIGIFLQFLFKVSYLYNLGYLILVDIISIFKRFYRIVQLYHEFIFY